MTRLVIPADVDYTTFDFDAFGERIDRSIPTVFPEWTDRSKANVGVIVKESIQFTGDVIAEYANSHSREAHLSVCTQQVNALRHARKLNYTPRGRTAATTTMQITLDAVAAGTVVAAEGSTVRARSSTVDVVRVQLLSDLVIAPGQLQGTASAENSATQTHAFESDDSKDQQEELPLSPFVEIVSVVDDIGTWTQVDNFLDSTSTDFHYRLLQSADGRAVLIFGDANQGRVPTGIVTITYKTGGGLVSVDAGDLTIPEFTLQDSLGNDVTFTITNTTPGSGGEDRETVDEIRINAPASLAATNRSVTKTDYETNARRVAGIARALMLTADQDPGIAENTGKLYLVARGTQLSSGKYPGIAPTQAQIDAVEALITNDYPPTITFTFEALSAVFETINIVCRVRLREGYSAAAVDANIRSALADYTAALNSDLTPNSEIDYGFNYKDSDGNPDPFVPWSDIFNAVRDAEGVRLVDKSTFQPYDDVQINGNNFPQIGTVTVLDDLTGLPLV